MPDNYDDEIKYSFSKFYKTSLSSVRGNATVTVYASNTLGEVHVKDFSIAIPAEKSMYTIILCIIVSMEIIYYY